MRGIVFLGLWLATLVVQAETLLNLAELQPALQPAAEARRDVTEALRIVLSDPRVHGRKLFLPAGDYLVSGLLAEMSHTHHFSLVGEGPNRTNIILYKDIQEPLFRCTGKELYAPPFDPLSWVTVDDLTFRGGRHTGTAFELEHCAHFYFSRVLFNGFNGPAVRGFNWWDTPFRECSFTNCGNAEKFQPAVILEGRRQPRQNARCNNIVFETCRFEYLPHGAIYFGEEATKCRVHSCKFDRAGNPHLFFDRCFLNIVEGSQFVENEAATMIYVKQCEGLQITGNIFMGDNQSLCTGLKLDQLQDSIVAFNSFGIRRRLKHNIQVIGKPGTGNYLHNVTK